MSSDHITSSDRLDAVESKLHRYYNSSIFDFSFFLAMSLVGTFCAPISPKYNQRKLFQIKAKLVRIKSDISGVYFLKELEDLIDSKLSEIERHQQYKSQSKYLDIKTTIILLWAQLLKISKSKTVYYSVLNKQLLHGKNIYQQEYSQEEVKKKFSFLDLRPLTNKDNHRGRNIVRVIENYFGTDWNGYYRLLKWFLNILNECSYISDIHIGSQEKETKIAKLRYEKSGFKYHRSILFASEPYFQGRKYFEQKKHSVTNKVDFFPFEGEAEVRPTILINFGKNEIEIGELYAKTILIKKFAFIDGEIIISEKQVPSSTTKTRFLSFPDGRSLTLNS